MHRATSRSHHLPSLPPPLPPPSHLHTHHPPTIPAPAQRWQSSGLVEPCTDIGPHLDPRTRTNARTPLSSFLLLPTADSDFQPALERVLAGRPKLRVFVMATSKTMRREYTTWLAESNAGRTGWLDLSPVLQRMNPNVINFSGKIPDGGVPAVAKLVQSRLEQFEADAAAHVPAGHDCGEAGGIPIKGLTEAPSLTVFLQSTGTFHCSVVVPFVERRMLVPRSSFLIRDTDVISTFSTF